ncbi:hypothetical protein B5M09_002045, partial [Aphanomyces astaci]
MMSVWLGLSTKFSSQYKTPFEDTSLDAATAATMRSERKLKLQEEVLLRQQDKIAAEIQKIEAAKKMIQRRQAREARRVAAEVNAAATVVQTAVRKHLTRRKELLAADVISLAWRQHCQRVEARRQEIEAKKAAAQCIAGSLRRHVRRRQREQGAVAVQRAGRKFLARRRAEDERLRRMAIDRQRRTAGALKIQSVFRCHVVRDTFLDIRDSVVQVQAAIRGHLCRRRRHEQMPPASGLEITPCDGEELGPEHDDDVEVDMLDQKTQVEPAIPREALGALSPVWRRRSSVQLPKLALSPKQLSDDMSEGRMSLSDMGGSSSPSRRLQKPCRQRRKTISVTLSPMPYKTVLVHQDQGDNSTAACRQRNHEDLRRKLLLRKEQDRLKELERQKRERREMAAMEREERASRVAWKVIARRESDKVQRQLKQELLDKAAATPMNRYERKPRGPIVPAKLLQQSMVVVVTKASESTIKKTATVKKKKRQKKGFTVQTTPESNQEMDGISESTREDRVEPREEDGDYWNDCAFDDLVDEAQLASLIVCWLVGGVAGVVGGAPCAVAGLASSLDYFRTLPVSAACGKAGPWGAAATPMDFLSTYNDDLPAACLISSCRTDFDTSASNFQAIACDEAAQLGSSLAGVRNFCRTFALTTTSPRCTDADAVDLGPLTAPCFGLVPRSTQLADVVSPDTWASYAAGVCNATSCVTSMLNRINTLSDCYFPWSALGGAPVSPKGYYKATVNSMCSLDICTDYYWWSGQTNSYLCTWQPPTNVTGSCAASLGAIYATAVSTACATAAFNGTTSLFLLQSTVLSSEYFSVAEKFAAIPTCVSDVLKVQRKLTSVANCISTELSFAINTFVQVVTSANTTTSNPLCTASESNGLLIKLNHATAVDCSVLSDKFVVWWDVLVPDQVSDLAIVTKSVACWNAAIAYANSFPTCEYVDVAKNEVATGVSAVDRFSSFLLAAQGAANPPPPPTPSRTLSPSSCFQAKNYPTYSFFNNVTLSAACVRVGPWTASAKPIDFLTSLSEFIPFACSQSACRNDIDTSASNWQSISC